MSVNQTQQPVLLRPAIIEVRYPDKDKFNNAVAMYKKLLLVAKDDKPAAYVCTFAVGSAAESKSKDILLRLTWNGAADSRTVIYWQVAGTKNDELSTLDGNLRLGPYLLHSEEGPGVNEFPESVIVKPPEPQPLLPYRSLLSDANSGSLVGVVINPPVPTIDKSGGHHFNFGLFDFGIFGLTAVGFLLVGIFSGRMWALRK